MSLGVPLVSHCQKGIVCERWFGDRLALMSPFGANAGKLGRGGSDDLAFGIVQETA